MVESTTGSTLPPKCHTTGCANLGSNAHMGYCLHCAAALDIPAAPPPTGTQGSSATSLPHQHDGERLPPALASDLENLPVLTAQAQHRAEQQQQEPGKQPVQQGDCRAGCGFFGAPERCWLCSSCWRKLGDDPFLGAVAATATDRVDPIQKYLDLGGSLQRTITPEEGTTLRKYGFYVTDGSKLVAVANDLGNMNSLAFLLQRDSSMQVVRESSKRATLSTLLPPPKHDLERVKSSPLPEAAQQQIGADGAVDGTVVAAKDVDASEDGPASFIAENVRLEIITTEQVRSDGLVHFWTGWEPEPDAADTMQSAESLQHGQHRPMGKSFALPACVGKLSPEQRWKALGKYLEQEDMADDIAKAVKFVGSVPQCDELVPLYTVADLNCLMHGAFTSIAGVRDGVFASDDPNASSANARTVLRNAVRNSLLRCRVLQETVAPATAARRPRSTTPPPVPVPPQDGEQPTDASSAAVTSPPPPDVEEVLRSPMPMSLSMPDDDGVDGERLKQLHVDIEQGRASLDGGHVFALANVLRRPIIVYAHVGLEGEFRKELTIPFRISGIYLPLLWTPAQTIPDPLIICYSSGHFSTMVPCLKLATANSTVSSPRHHDDTERNSPHNPDDVSDAPAANSAGYASTPSSSARYFDARLPLCDEEFVPLPVHFLKEAPATGKCPHVAEILAKVTNPQQRRGRHSDEELAVLRAYLRDLEVVPLIEGLDEEEDDATTTAAPVVTDGTEAPAADDTPVVPRITLCTQRHAPHRLSATGNSNATDSQTEQYVSSVWEAVERVVHEYLAGSGGASAPPPASSARREGQLTASPTRAQPGDDDIL
jgi:hypothetical protein